MVQVPELRLRGHFRKKIKTMMYTPDIFIGIDPGVKTGYAEYWPSERTLYTVGTFKMDQARQLILNNIAISNISICVIIEDARKRGGSPETRFGAGSVTRDCKLWEEWLEDNNIPHVFVRPRRFNTKNDAALFQQVTGWKGRTSNHARDAAMLVYGTNNIPIVNVKMLSGEIGH